jgi:hypothetical protein
MRWKLVQSATRPQAAVNQAGLWRTAKICMSAVTCPQRKAGHLPADRPSVAATLAALTLSDAVTPAAVLALTLTLGAWDDDHDRRSR